MKKRYFWAFKTDHGAKSTFLHRFRTMGDRQAWMDKNSWAEVIGGDHPEVRRILRRMVAGDQIVFPVEV